MRRIQRGVSRTLSHTITVDAVATNPSPDSATVTITRADGTAIVTDAEATDAGQGLFTYTLTPAQTATLGVLSAQWTFTTAGYEQTPDPDQVEVVGRPYFALDEFYARYADVDPATYPPTTVDEVRSLVEETLEDATGTAWVPRGGYDRSFAVGTGLSLPNGPVRAVLSATDSDDATIDVTLADFQGSFVTRSWWPSRAITVSYEYGHDRPPSRVKQAAMILTRAWLVRGPTDDRETQRGNPDGSVVNLATPGLLGAVVGVPEVDAVIEQYRLVSV